MSRLEKHRMRIMLRREKRRQRRKKNPRQGPEYKIQFHRVRSNPMNFDKQPKHRIQSILAFTGRGAQSAKSIHRRGYDEQNDSARHIIINEAMASIRKIHKLQRRSKTVY